MLKLEPMQWGGSEEYHCDLGESALAIFYLSAYTWLICDWHYYDHFGQLQVKRGQGGYRGPQASSWFINTGYQRVVRLVWSVIEPGWFVEGTCV